MNAAAEAAYLLAAGLFILGLKWLASPLTARRGNATSALGMLLAITATLWNQGIVDYRWLAVGLIIGALLGTVMARTVPMTGMPELVALLNGFGGLASAAVAWTEYLHHPGHRTPMIVLSVLIGAMTFSGSLIAWAKLGERISGRPLLFTGQKTLNAAFALLTLLAGACFCLGGFSSQALLLLLAISALALFLGLGLVFPIGGADMPVVIALLNSFSGLAAAATGFVLRQPILIVTGSLVGASGAILTQIMCKAMNRSLSNVIFGGFGATTSKSSKPDDGEVRPISVDDAHLLLEAARVVVIVPGYGLAVAQAQHAVRELVTQLANNGTDVVYAIHPVAGRMPGHMNVLLAEADVPYEQMVEMEAVNARMPAVDVCLVIGANDVVNPAARDEPGSPLYGMPIINADQARSVIVMKRSLATGFAGVENRLFTRQNTRLLFGDAKASLQALSAQFAAA